MAAIKYKDPSTNLWEEVGEIIKGKDAAYVGSSAPTDPQYTIWVDTSETGEGLVTSVNGQVGAVTVTVPTKTSDLTNDSGFVTALAAYPVGSIYMSVNSTSPATLFGGTWEQIEDTFLLAAGSTYAGGSTGGRSEVTLSAAIGAANAMATGICYKTDSPSAWQYANTSGVYNLGATSRADNVGSGWNHSTPVTEKTGTNRNVNIMPPYLAVYVWKRTA